jgi:hypothetical protein
MLHVKLYGEVLLLESVFCALLLLLPLLLLCLAFLPARTAQDAIRGCDL